MTTPNKLTPTAPRLELPWIQVARSYIGLREIPGPKHSKTIQNWLGILGGWWADDETPWCGTFVAACLVQVGLAKPAHWYRARAYLDYGIGVDQPTYGAILVFMRAGGGHVGFCVGKDDNDRLMVLGGNQGNAVSVVPFDRARLVGVRWPSLQNWQPAAYLPTLGTSAASSTQES